MDGSTLTLGRACALGAAALLVACGQEQDSVEAEPAAEPLAEISADPETEAPKPPPARTGDPADDDVAYLHQLGQVSGHLVAFIELYRAQAYDQAMSHAKHPSDEIYADLEPAFEARDARGFAAELSALVAAAEERGDVESAYGILKEAIASNEPPADARARIGAAAALVATAAEEFAEGVDENGAVVNPHEYQDAYGFLHAAREMLSQTDANDIDAGDAIAVAHEQIDMALNNNFDGLLATATEGDAAAIEASAIQIERAAERLY